MPRVVTHSWFSFGASVFLLAVIQHTPFLLSYFGGQAYESHVLTMVNFPFRSFSLFGINPEDYLLDLGLCVSLAWLLNEFMDVAGHRVTGGRFFKKIQRSYRTHQIGIALMWGALIPLACIATPLWVFQIVSFSPVRSIVIEILTIGAFITGLHLLLDVTTPDGIYLTKTKHFHLLEINGLRSGMTRYFSGVGFLLAALPLVYWNIPNFVIFRSTNNLSVITWHGIFWLSLIGLSLLVLFYEQEATKRDKRRDAIRQQYEQNLTSEMNRRYPTRIPPQAKTSR